MGLSSVVNPVLAWVDAGDLFADSLFAGVSFFTRNGSASNNARIAIRIGGNWYVSAQTFSDVGNNSGWAAQDFDFFRQCIRMAHAQCVHAGDRRPAVRRRSPPAR